MSILNEIKGIYKHYKSNYMLEHAYEREITNINDLEYLFTNIPEYDLVEGGGAIYGHGYHIKRYAHFPEDAILNCAIEHGLNITQHTVCEIHASYPVKSILTFSMYRKKIIEDVTNMTAIPIGPYIAYADDYRSKEEMEKMKKYYGKTLLVFPDHGIRGLEIIYDVDEFAKIIDKISNGFKTVFVCLTAHDIEVGLAKFYKRYGYTVVTSGLGSDKYFLSRQRLIFQLSDAVCSNSFTTGLAYALYFDKPIYLFRQSIKFKNIENNNVDQLKEDNKIMEELFSICSDLSFKMLDEQKKWANYYWGLNEIKTRSELKSILLPLMR